MEATIHTKTTTLLLQRLGDAQNTAEWSEFDARYRPVLVGVGMHMGLRRDDAEEVAQETLAQFARDYLDGRYNRERGRLRAWLIGICRHRVLDAHRRLARHRANRSDSALMNIADVHTLTKAWEEEERRVIFKRAMEVLCESERIAQSTIRTFEMVALEGLSAAAVAETNGLTVAEVYRVKHRVARRLREIVAQLTDAHHAEE
ncbi:MAG: sigma-70 family RNA polymerase sigma factor [Planctomycetota bacterium]